MQPKKYLYTIVLCTALAINFAALANPVQRVFDITQYGAKADGRTNNALALQKAIDACWRAGGGKVLVPGAGIYLAGPFNLRSHVQFEVAADATLLASPDEKLYTESAFRANKGEGTIWIGGKDLEGVTLCGGGTIDGNGITFMGKELGDSYELKPFNVVDPRPHLLTLINCKQLRIRDLVIRNSAYWTIHLVGCNDVVINGITLLNSIKVRNSDGIDLDHSKNVRISDCYIESGDDCICLKNRREYQEYGACTNIVVSNCTMTSSSCAIKIGSENMDSISHVLINNCIIKNSNRGLGIQNRDEGTVSDVVFSNILIDAHLFSDVWWGKAEPIYVTAYTRATTNNKDAGWRLPPGESKGRVGRVNNIYFSNIKCQSENGIYLSGETADKITGIYFDNVDLQLNKTTNNPGGVYDRRPANVEGLIKGRTSGFYLDQATDITIRNSSVKWGVNRPSYFAHVLEAHGINNLKVTGLDGEAALPNVLKIVQ
ncbi:glycoside hydrolase family 28 protein [Mucilaginibacter glaciei]|uniref:Glycoside hydrolase family 28 protein n=1 Tax=Mucilaginibacter glaciei TaxID=2772109 RepID=A0A926NQ94_9SPHI|nr:glycoside hydrolase family 28 protein [Mucilaginibacter glaciei]MBD1393408.1 glycoside hydrolase family 28 protein [Mucilaginibacter glaciei]